MNDTQNPEELKKEVQVRIVDLITRKLEAGQMSADRAREIAKMILDRMSGNISFEELIKLIPKLDDQFQELSQVIVPIMVDYEKRMREEINTKIDLHLKQQNFDEVLRIAKEAIEHESQLT